MSRNLMEIRSLVTDFITEEGVARAVNHIDIELPRGSTLGLVGESGCGKTVTALSVMQLVPSPPGKIVSGSILFDDMDLLTLSEKVIQDIRGKRIGMIFQEPMTSLNPVMTIGTQISETLKIHLRMGKAEAEKRVLDLLDLVCIPDAASRLKSYPHELSGGMRQRVMIAMALACKPELLIADEPTTALDVTIQAQILNLLNDLKKELGMSVLLITHDFGVVAQVAASIAVMYAGSIVEKGTAVDVIRHPRHPYTVGLLECVPRLEGETGKLTTIPGAVPALTELPEGCPFADRCRAVVDGCCEQFPEMQDVSDTHSVRCMRWKEL